jgi:TctA family transporter
MQLCNRYFVTLAIVLTASTVILAAYDVQRLDAYFSLYVIAYLVITLLFAHIHPRARRLLDMLGYVLFAGFLGIVAFKVAEILRGAPS